MVGVFLPTLKIQLDSLVKNQESRILTHSEKTKFGLQISDFQDGELMKRVVTVILQTQTALAPTKSQMQSLLVIEIIALFRRLKRY